MIDIAAEETNKIAKSDKKTEEFLKMIRQTRETSTINKMSMNEEIEESLLCRICILVLILAVFNLLLLEATICINRKRWQIYQTLNALEFLMGHSVKTNRRNLNFGKIDHHGHFTYEMSQAKSLPSFFCMPNARLRGYIEECNAVSGNRPLVFCT